MMPGECLRARAQPESRDMRDGPRTARGRHAASGAPAWSRLARTAAHVTHLMSDILTDTADMWRHLRVALSAPIAALPSHVHVMCRVHASLVMDVMIMVMIDPSCHPHGAEDEWEVSRRSSGTVSFRISSSCSSSFVERPSSSFRASVLIALCTAGFARAHNEMMYSSRSLTLHCVQLLEDLVQAALAEQTLPRRLQRALAVDRGKRCGGDDCAADATAVMRCDVKLPPREVPRCGRTRHEAAHESNVFQAQRRVLPPRLLEDDGMGAQEGACIVRARDQIVHPTLGGALHCVEDLVTRCAQLGKGMR